MTLFLLSSLPIAVLFCCYLAATWNTVNPHQ